MYNRKTPRRSRAPYHLLIKLPGTFSATQAFHPSPFPVPSSLSLNPPSVLVHPQHPPVRGACMYSASPRCHYAPSDTGASLGSCPTLIIFILQKSIEVVPADEGVLLILQLVPILTLLFHHALKEAALPL